MTGYYKFLRPGRVSPFARFRWPEPGTWVDVAEIDPCRSGVHACRTGDLPYWLDEELWRVELDGPVVETAVKVVAGRGRLVRRVDAWSAATAHEFGLACVGRLTGHAAEELRSAALDDAAADLTAAGSLEDVKSAAERAVSAAGAADRVAAERVGSYLIYAIDTLESAAGVSYIAAKAAGRLEGGTDRERAWQAAWLDERLGLSRRPSLLSFLRRRR